MEALNGDELVKTLNVYMKVMCYPEEKGLGGGVATTIHSWRGRLATPPPNPDFHASL